MRCVAAPALVATCPVKLAVLLTSSDVPLAVALAIVVRRHPNATSKPRLAMNRTISTASGSTARAGAATVLAKLPAYLGSYSPVASSAANAMIAKPSITRAAIRARWRMKARKPKTRNGTGVRYALHPSAPSAAPLKPSSGRSCKNSAAPRNTATPSSTSPTASMSML